MMKAERVKEIPRTTMKTKVSSAVVIRSLLDTFS